MESVYRARTLGASKGCSPSKTRHSVSESCGKSAPNVKHPRFPSIPATFAKHRASDITKLASTRWTAFLQIDSALAAVRFAFLRGKNRKTLVHERGAVTGVRERAQKNRAWR